MNETQLLNGLRQQDPAAVRHLSECYLPSVWRFVCVRVGGDQHLAEDIVSETVLALIRAAAMPEGEIENPGAWLRTVANRKVNDHFRAAARVKHLIDQVKHTADAADHDGPASRNELQERREAIRGVMNQLPESHRLALEWKYIDKLSVREIALRLDLTEKAVESVLFRARKDFRDKLQRHTDEVPLSSEGSEAATSRTQDSTSDRKASRETSSSPQRSEDDSSQEGEQPADELRAGEMRTGEMRASLEVDAVEHPVGAEHSIPGHQGE